MVMQQNQGQQSSATVKLLLVPGKYFSFGSLSDRQLLLGCLFNDEVYYTMNT